MNNNSSGIGCLGYILIIPLIPIILPFVMIGSMFSSNDKHKSSKSKQRYSEDVLDAYGLMEDEKELVRKGEYDPWDFEENEMLEDDDYYNED